MTTGEDVRGALERRAAAPEAQTIYDLIERQRPAIERALPAAIGAERFTRIVVTELKRNPALLECSAESLLGGLMLAAQLGLEPGPLGHVYLVPFKREATFIIGYRGMIDLARRSGHLRDIVARTVHEGEAFEYEFGLTDRLKHRPLPPADRGEPVCYYGVARFTNGGKQLAVLYPDEVEARRKRSPAGAKQVGPWATDYDAMARKSVIRAMWPYLPSSPTLAQAVEYDEAPAPPLAPEPVALDAVRDGGDDAACDAGDED